MNIQQAYIQAQQQLTTIYPLNEAKNIANLLIEFVCNYSSIQRIIFKDNILSNQQQMLYSSCLQRLLQHEPIQYITNKEWFCAMPFLVNKHTLIPRPETEELVHKIIYQNTIINPNIIDIGTGSGCIAIALKKQILTATITAIDISNNALQVATHNALQHNTSIAFKQINFLEDYEWNDNFCEKKFDIIVSNPPYIKQNEQSTMNNNVVQYEPHWALFVENNDPLIFYKKIVLFAKHFLTKNGNIWVEINENLWQETENLFNSYGFKTLLYKDFQEKYRIINAFYYTHLI